MNIANHLIIRRTTPTTKHHPAWNIIRVEVEKPWIRRSGRITRGRGGNPKIGNCRKPLSPPEPAGQWENAVLTEAIRGSNKRGWQEREETVQRKLKP